MIGERANAHPQKELSAMTRRDRHSVHRHRKALLEETGCDLTRVWPCEGAQLNPIGRGAYRSCARWRHARLQFGRAGSDELCDVVVFVTGDVPLEIGRASCRERG